jgi:serine protease Do
MKQYLLKLAGIVTAMFMLTTGSFAQQDKKGSNSKHSDDVIIIKQKGDKNTKLTIEINGADVKVNGKPLSEFKDDDVIISKRKQITVNGEDAMSNRLHELITPPSRFRGGTSYGYGFSDDNMPAIAGVNSNKAFLGVTTEKADEGVTITDVTDESAAEKAGLKEDDIITKINDTKIESPEELTKAIGKFKPEEKITVTIKRDKKEQKLTATLTKRKDAFALSGDNFNFNMAPLNHAFSYDGFNWNKGKLGIRAQETEDGKGIKVVDVDDESPAEKAGIKEDDVITEFDGVEVNNVDKLKELAKTAMGKVAFKVKLNRDGKQQEVDVKIPKNLKTTNL